jgi:1-acyl-sn-glycerol-3-phosphate acyltransferase
VAKLKRMKKVFLYIISLIYYFFFLVVLIFFQPIQWIALKVFGYSGLKNTFDFVTLLSLKCCLLIGVRYTFENRELIPKNVPIIFVSNHQSLYDTVGLNWYLRRFHCAFVTKKELGKGIPGVSFYIRNSKCVQIDRNNPKQAIPQIKALAEYIETNNRSAIIFPEGTRSKTGEPKEFAQSGVKILCKYAPSAYVVPVSINNSWEIVKNGSVPLSLGHHLLFTVHKPLAVSEYSFDEIMQKTENAIVNGIKV